MEIPYSQLVLKDGTVIELSKEQSDRLAYVILATPNIDTQKVSVGGVKFKLADMLTSQEKEKMLKKKREEKREKDQQGLDF